MADTQTIVNKSELSAEQKALAQAELSQIQRRQAFENFMTEVLMGFPLGSTTTAAGTSPKAPAPTPTGGNSSKSPSTNSNLQMVGNAANVASLGNLLNRPTDVTAPSVSTGQGQGTSFLDSLLSAKTLGAVAGVAAGIPGGATTGGMIGQQIGNLFTPKGDAPSAAEVKNSVSLPAPTPVASVKLPVDYSPEGPSGATTAARAQQTAMRDMYHNAITADTAMTPERLVNDAGLGAAQAGQGMGSYIQSLYSNAALNAANQAKAELAAQGIGQSDPRYIAYINNAVQTAVDAIKLPEGWK